MPGRLVVRRIPDVHAAAKKAAGQGTLFDVWRFHAFFTTAPADTVDTVAADKTHRGHAIIEQVHADLKNSALAHLPSGKFTANAAWLVLAVIAFNLTRAAASLTAATRARESDHRDGPSQADPRPRPGRVLRAPDHPAPARSVALARGVDPTVRPRRRPARHGTVLTTQPQAARPEEPGVEHPDSEVGRSRTPLATASARDDDQRHTISPSVDRGLAGPTFPHLGVPIRASHVHRTRPKRKQPLTRVSAGQGLFRSGGRYWV